MRVFGLDPARDEVAVKSRLAYVPDARRLLSVDDRARDARLLRVVPRALERGDRTRAARPVPPRPAAEDEPPVEGPADAARADHARSAPSRSCWSSTSRRPASIRSSAASSSETVIGAYQDGDAGDRTVFVSTHLISEFEGLIDEFTIIDGGRDVLTLERRCGARALPEDLRAVCGGAGRPRSAGSADDPPARARDRGGGERQSDRVCSTACGRTLPRLWSPSRSPSRKSWSPRCSLEQPPHDAAAIVEAGRRQGAARVRAGPRGCADGHVCLTRACRRPVPRRRDPRLHGRRRFVGRNRVRSRILVRHHAIAARIAAVAPFDGQHQGRSAPGLPSAAGARRSSRHLPGARRRRA